MYALVSKGTFYTSKRDLLRSKKDLLSLRVPKHIKQASGTNKMRVMQIDLDVLVFPLHVLRIRTRRTRLQRRGYGSGARSLQPRRQGLKKMKKKGSYKIDHGGAQT